MSMRLILVNYDREIRKRFENIFNHAGNSIYTASSIYEAKTIISNSPCDVVICETYLEDGSAFDLKFYLDISGSSARFIVTTAKGDIKTILEALNTGDYDVIKKPFSDDELKNIINRAVKDVIFSEKIDVRKLKAGWIEVQIPSLENSMQRLDRFFKLIYEDYVSPEVLKDISICFKEIVRNAIEWGHKFDVSKNIRISHMLHKDEFFIKIDDDGEGFDASACLRSSQNLLNKQSEREKAGLRPGGMGISIVSGLMDKVMQNEKGNSIVFSKKIRKSNLLTI